MKCADACSVELQVREEQCTINHLHYLLGNLVIDEFAKITCSSLRSVQVYKSNKKVTYLAQPSLDWMIFGIPTPKIMMISAHPQAQN